MHTFSILEALRFAWDMVRKNFGFFILFSVLVFGIIYLLFYLHPSFLLSLLAGPVLGPEIAPARLPLWLNASVIVLVTIVLAVWTIRVGLDATDAKRLSFSSIIPAWDILPKFALLSIIIIVPFLVLSQLTVQTLFIGLLFASMGSASLLEVMPGIGVVLLPFVGFGFLYLRFLFSWYHVVDQKLGLVQSMKASWCVTRGKVLKLIGLMLVLALLNIVGMMALFIGLLVTVPITIVAWAYVYRSLVGSPDSVPAPGGDLVEPVPNPTV